MTVEFIKKEIINIAKNYDCFVEFEYFDDKEGALYLSIKFMKLEDYLKFTKELFKFGKILRNELEGINKGFVKLWLV